MMNRGIVAKQKMFCKKSGEEAGEGEGGWAGPAHSKKQTGSGGIKGGRGYSSPKSLL